MEQLEIKYDMSNPKVVRKMIETKESSLYGTVNEDGEKVMVSLEKGVGLEVRTFQSNGWCRVDFYNKIGIKEGETFEGRWDKKD